jgi:hypothetical protein
MSIGILKVQVEHLERWAYIYVRQSSMAQVTQHQESTRRQYECLATIRMQSLIIVVRRLSAQCHVSRLHKP